ncbi:CU044_2847 family protein [Kribbella sp. C-35]|uniref:CU044_2847 family protein n=1 Tax=Kribbella sp. C-35 TaxID=2789276 RepID=UPI00397DA9FB
MKELVEFDAADGGSLVVEVDDDDGADYVRAASPGELVGRAVGQLDDALGVIQTTARAVVHQVVALDEKVRPDEAIVDFGVTLTGKVGGVLAAAQGEAHLKVTLKWTRSS